MALDWTTFLSGGAGAFGAAWIGAYVGFRRSKKERALDRRIAWHEATIQSLAQYEEQLERIHAHTMNFLIAQRTNAAQKAGKSDENAEMPNRVRISAPLWKELRDIESKARGYLRLADLYTEGRTQSDCSVALTNTVNVVSSQWLDISDSPEIAWASVSNTAMFTATLRRKVQDSLRLVLELDGFIGHILGPKYRRWSKIRGLKKLQAEHQKELGAYNKFAAEASSPGAS